MSVESVDSGLEGIGSDSLESVELSVELSVEYSSVVSLPDQFSSGTPSPSVSVTIESGVPSPSVSM
ncbi:hypothetical protein [Gulosibacter sediminis]|uniref:hypothetical protein n=1 Tax=Gulosibacter sediminis TaxID=1729695 RepID=UPI0024A9BC31|nr:hypothetical protein [Gulosibacter sediminis]